MEETVEAVDRGVSADYDKTSSPNVRSKKGDDIELTDTDRMNLGMLIPDKD